MYGHQSKQDLLSNYYKEVNNNLFCRTVQRKASQQTKCTTYMVFAQSVLVCVAFWSMLAFAPNRMKWWLAGTSNFFNIIRLSWRTSGFKSWRHRDIGKKEKLYANKETQEPLFVCVLSVFASPFDRGRLRHGNGR